MNSLVKDITESGFAYFRGAVDTDWIHILREKSEISFELHHKIQIKNGIENPNRWLALNAIGDCSEYLKFAERLILDREIDQFLNDYFDSSFILNSFSVLSSVAGNENFSLKVHRDSRDYAGNSSLMLNFLVMLDDFMPDNGATHFLSASHLKREKPSDEYFYSNCSRAIGKAGDVLVFHSDTWHAAGRNLTNLPRRGIAITFTKPFMKQLVDIPRMIGENELSKLDQRMRKILGFTSRVPANLDEWYQPVEKRYYLSEVQK